MIKPTPYLYTAVGVALLALLLGLGDILAGIGHRSIDTQATLTLPLQAEDRRVKAVAADVVQPIADAGAVERSRNPFNLKPAFKQRILRIPLPPPPSLGSPEPPVFPLDREE